MRRMVIAVCLGMSWISAALAITGFFLPWATLDVKASRLAGQLGQVAGPVGQVTQDTPLQGLASSLRKHVGKVVIHVKRGAEVVTGELPDLSTIPTQVSGVEIPRLANRHDVQVVVALAEMLAGQRDVGKKSYAVYLLPGLALVCGILMTLARRVRLVCSVVGVVCLGVAGVGCWKLLTTNTETLLVSITIGQGLWLSLWAYAGLGLSALALAMLGPR